VQLGKDDATALAIAGFTLGHVVKELDDGAAFLDRAWLISRNLAVGWFAGGWIKVWLGERDRAIERFAQVCAVSPIDPRTGFMQAGMANAHFFAGRYDEAVPWAKMALRELPHSNAGLPIAAASCALAGRDEKAKRLPEIRACRREDRQHSIAPEKLTPSRYGETLNRLQEAACLVRPSSSAPAGAASLARF